MKLEASDGAAYDKLGISVALSGDTALGGAYLEDDNGASSGSAYVFVRSAGVWSQKAELVASDGAASDWFGISVALSGDTAIVGATLDDDLGMLLFHRLLELPAVGRGWSRGGSGAFFGFKALPEGAGGRVGGSGGASKGRRQVGGGDFGVLGGSGAFGGGRWRF